MNKKLYTVGGIIIVVLFSIGIFRTFSHVSANAIHTDEVQRRNVVQKVSVSGKVESEEVFDLAFSTSAPVKTIRVKEGDSVTKGEILATLDVSDIAMQQAQAKAVLLSDRQMAGLTLEKSQVALKTLQTLNHTRLVEAKIKLMTQKQLSIQLKIFGTV